jgi:hypothetical protein
MWIRETWPPTSRPERATAIFWFGFWLPPTPWPCWCSTSQLALVLSQVLLSFGIPFALIPLIPLTGNRSVMGIHTDSLPLRIGGWTSATLIVVLNTVLIVLTFTGQPEPPRHNGTGVPAAARRPYFCPVSKVPWIAVKGTAPKSLESMDTPRLSPSTKTAPAGTFSGPKYVASIRLWSTKGSGTWTSST